MAQGCSGCPLLRRDGGDEAESVMIGTNAIPCRHAPAAASTDGAPSFHEGIEGEETNPSFGNEATTEAWVVSVSMKRAHASIRSCSLLFPRPASLIYGDIAPRLDVFPQTTSRSHQCACRSGIEKRSRSGSVPRAMQERTVHRGGGAPHYQGQALLHHYDPSHNAEVSRSGKQRAAQTFPTTTSSPGNRTEQYCRSAMQCLRCLPTN